MRTIGLVGGTGWVSTIEYYRLINESINLKLGGLNFSKCIIYSLNYGDIHKYNLQNDDESIYNLVKEASIKLENSGSDCIALCANTLHRFAARLKKEIKIPLIHIAEATAKTILERNIYSVGLLGTKQTMEEDFYKSILMESGINVIVPDEKDREFIHFSIMNELLKEIFREDTKQKFIEIMNKLKHQGAHGIILGCTEIPLLIDQDDFNLELFNTLEIHVEKIVEFAVK